MRGMPTLTDAEARAEILRRLEIATKLGSLRGCIYLNTEYGASGPAGHSAYRFIHYGEPAGLDDELKRAFIQALRRIDHERARELLAILEAFVEPSAPDASG